MKTLIMITLIFFLSVGNVHAGQVFKHEDWRVIELTDWKTDKKTYIAKSTDATIRRDHFPYKGPFQLQYECSFEKSSLFITTANPPNLRYGEERGFVKFDDKQANNDFFMNELSDGRSYLRLQVGRYWQYWDDMVQSNRMRVWMPYHGGDIIVDFPLTGFTAAAKQTAKLNGCKNSILILAGIEKEKKTVGHCDKLVKGFASVLSRGFDKTSVHENHKIQKQRQRVDESCSHLGKTLTDLYIKHGVDISE